MGFEQLYEGRAMSGLADVRCWHVAQLRPNGLERACAHVRAQGFEFLAPRMLATRRTRYGLRTMARAVFPGYLFVGVTEDSAPPARLGGTRGIARVLTDGRGRFAELPEGVMSALEARLDGEGFLEPPSGLEKGDRVEVVRGPFAGWLGEVTGAGASDRVRLLLQLLGGEVPVDIAAGALRRA